ncbi:MAG: hypothetical protein IPK13_06295 [Deltaproteobacteria bacterium]|nr:hypothetical protein [Deltaproteobacteria bacterium]
MRTYRPAAVRLNGLKLFALTVVVGSSVSASGCIRQALVNGQIASTREASLAFNQVDDWEMAYNAASAGIVQFEGMHRLAPRNLDALFMLARAYAGYGYGFVEDDLEVAEDALDQAAIDSHRARAVSAYGKAVTHGLALWAARGISGFDEAQRDETTLRAWLEANFTEVEDAGDLLYVAAGWLSRANLKKDDPASVAELWIGFAILERALALNESENGYSGLMMFAAYHARSVTADLDLSRKTFEDVIKKTGRQSLLALFNYATKYACAKGDAELYNRLLEEVVTAEPSDANYHLMNAIAKRRARRWLHPQRMFDACSFGPLARLDVTGVDNAND